jgi:hypothetical protein
MLGTTDENPPGFHDAEQSGEDFEPEFRIPSDGQHCCLCDCGS